MATSIFTDLSKEFVATLGDNLFSAVGSFISGLAPLFAAGFGIYVMIVALNAYNRGLDDNIIGDLCKIPPKSPKLPPRHLGDFS